MLKQVQKHCEEKYHSSKQVICPEKTEISVEVGEEASGRTTSLFSNGGIVTHDCDSLKMNFDCNFHRL